MYTAIALQRAAALPVNQWAGLLRNLWSHPLFPGSGTTFGRAVASAGELVERATRRYGKPPFALRATRVDGREVEVRETVALATPFCNLLHFERATPRRDPAVLVVAPLSGHHASLLRDTVEQLLPEHDVWITDWIDARLIPLAAGPFDLDDYIALVQRFLRHMGSGAHLLAVCQPGVAALAATALLEEDGDPASPLSVTLLASPIDTRVSPTGVSRLALRYPLSTFDLAAVHRVPFGEPGFMRRVYPGFLQLAAFLSMNPGRHASAHRSLYFELVEGQQDAADVYRRFYDDYLAVMDVPGEYYLQTVQCVFQTHALPRGTMTWRGRPVRPQAIRRAALMTVEGGRDDITGVGQTAAAHALCPGVPAERHASFVAPTVGHYGVFSGRRWREEIAPRVAGFIRAAAPAGAGGA